MSNKQDTKIESEVPPANSESSQPTNDAAMPSIDSEEDCGGDCGCDDCGGEVSQAAAIELRPSADIAAEAIALEHRVPGFEAVQGVQVSPEEARKIIESRPEPSNLWRPPHAFGVRRDSKNRSFAGIPAPASVAETARGLRYNVDNIYEHVYNQVEFHPIYGLNKSVEETLIGAQGNNWEQCRAFVELLRLSGYTANYVFGTIRLTQTQLGLWFGTDPVQVNAAFVILQNGGFPFTYAWNGTEYTFDIAHIWAKVNIGGTWYVFDPCYKTWVKKLAIDLGAAMGYNRATFKSRAISGATITSNSVQLLNTANITADLDTFSANLTAYIKTNNPTAKMEDIIGGREIIPLAGAVRLTSLPYQKPGDVPTEWTGDIPNAYKATLRVQFPGLDQTFFPSDISHDRMTFFYNGTTPELRVDGALIATGTPQGIGTYNSIYIEAKHPYPSTFADRSAYLTVVQGGSYTVLNSWGPTGAGMEQYKGANLRANIVSGFSQYSEETYGENLDRQANKYTAEVSFLNRMVGGVTDTQTLSHHAVGLVGDNSSTDRYGFTNVGTAAFAVLSNTYNTAQSDIAVSQIGRVGYFSEGKTAGEMQITRAPVFSLMRNVRKSGAGIKSFGAGYCRAVPEEIIPKAASDSLLKIKSAATEAELDDVELAADGYTAGYIANLHYYASTGQNPLYTTQGPVALGTSGRTYTAIETRDAYNGVNGLVASYKGEEECKSGGGGGGFPQPEKAKKKPKKTGGDPVSVSDGSFLYSHDDISVGSGSFPYELEFQRFYNSGLSQVMGPLGYGWTHNFLMSIQATENNFVDLGNDHTLLAVPAMVMNFVMNDIVLAAPTQPVEVRAISILTGQWWEKRTIGKSITVSLPNESQRFVQMPDGSYQSPLDSRATLIENGDGSFTMKSQEGVAYNFNGTTGKITTIVFPYGMTLSFTYTSGKLTSVSNGLTRQLTLAYTGNFISQVTDGTGRSVSFVVDGSSNLTSFTDEDSKVTQYQYSQPGLMTKIFYPANPATAAIENIYDSLNRVKEQKDGLGNLTQFFIAGSRTEEVDPAGNSEITYFNNSGEPIREINALGYETKSEFDGLNRLIKVTAPEGNITQYQYNSKDLVTLTTFKAKPGSPLADITNSFTYHPVWNKVATQVDGLGRTTTLNYDAATGNLLNIQYPLVAAQLPQETWTYNSRGQVLTYTDETGVVTQNTFDVTTEKLLTTVIDPGISPHLSLTTQYGYNSVGDVTSVIDPRGFTTIYTFDSKRRLTQITDPAPFSYISKFTFDANDNKIKVERQTGDVLNPWEINQASFDTDDNLKTTTDPQNNVTVFDYNNLNLLWKTTDADLRVTTIHYDQLHRLADVVDSSGTTVNIKAYTPNGLVASDSDSRSNLTQYVYDGFDRLDKTIYPGSTYEQLTYDANGNALTARTRAGLLITMTYDVLNRLATSAPAAQGTVTNTYDLAGRLIKAAKPVVAGDPSTGDHQFFFDTAGRQFKESYPDGKEIIYQLDANSNATKITYPDGYFVERVYDQIDRLTDIKLNGSVTAAAHFDYDPRSRRTKLTYSNGAMIDYGYELDNDLASLVHTFVGSSATFSYLFSNAHKLLSEQTSDKQFNWSPSAVGTTTYQTANNLNQYPVVGAASFSYNTAGCLTGDSVWTYGFDTENHLLSASKAGTSLAFVYDPLERQTQKAVTTAGTVKSRYVYSGWQRIADYDGTGGALQNRYVYATGLDEPIIQVSAAGVLTFFHADHSGSIVATSSSTGAVTNKYSFGPFGETALAAASGFGYTAQRFDSESGLYYYKNRIFAPALGRFLQPDPSGYVDGLNLYTYVNNEPTNFTDPMGLEAKKKLEKFIDALKKNFIPIFVKPTATKMATTIPAIIILGPVAGKLAGPVVRSVVNKVITSKVGTQVANTASSTLSKASSKLAQGINQRNGQMLDKVNSGAFNPKPFTGHGNSLKNTNASQNYRIQEVQTKELYKDGIASGKHIDVRPNDQVDALNKTAGYNKYEKVDDAFWTNRRQARTLELQKNLDTINRTGGLPPGSKVK
ncbi:MAG: hypothetical protein C0473_03625 [Cyanobacteria bacterium DS3.002]|nr:hypothetical protein [Cyanobacteria bacterium DS3.002]MBA4049797.1 hypothetical protein [Cyanobacteria bacterium DS2.008]